MAKKIIFLFLSIITLLMVLYLFFEGRDNDIDQSNQTKPSNEDSAISEENEDKGTEIIHIVDKVYTLAQKGMIMDVTIEAGKSEYKEVTKMYGEPERIDETSVGDFAVYEYPQVTIGYQNSIAYDVRSYASSLKEIHYQDILDRLGEPDEVKYYQDHNYNQIILIYHVSSNYRLKWILNKPDDIEQNPAVEHISVLYIGIPKQNQTDISLSTDQLINQMSIDEKIGQMIFAGISGTEFNKKAEHLINNNKVGGIIFNAKNINSPNQTVAYLNALKTMNRNNKVPLFFGIDQEGGRISKLPGNLIAFPSNKEIGMMNNPSFSFEIGSVLGKLVKAYGFNLNFAPVLDVNSNPKNPVIGDRSFGNNPHLVSELGIQTMKGLQSEKIIPTIKHFPGHGDTSDDSHLKLPTVNKSLTELENLELVPFRHAIDEGADMVMLAHILLPKIDKELPSSLSAKIITMLLRNQLDFDGVIITDDMTMGAIVDNFDIGVASVMSVKAGSDMIMVAHNYDNVRKVFSALKKAVNHGEISEERINESVTRILDLKRKYEISNSISKEVDIPGLNQLIKSVLDKDTN